MKCDIVKKSSYRQVRARESLNFNWVECWTWNSLHHESNLLKSIRLGIPSVREQSRKLNMASSLGQTHNNIIFTDFFLFCRIFPNIFRINRTNLHISFSRMYREPFFHLHPRQEWENYSLFDVWLAFHVRSVVSSSDGPKDEEEVFHMKI